MAYIRVHKNGTTLKLPNYGFCDTAQALSLRDYFIGVFIVNLTSPFWKNPSKPITRMKGLQNP